MNPSIFKSHNELQTYQNIVKQSTRDRAQSSKRVPSWVWSWWFSHEKNGVEASGCQKESSPNLWPNRSSPPFGFVQTLVQTSGMKMDDKVLTKYYGIPVKKFTLQGINISHLGKRKIIFKMPFVGGYVSFLEGIVSCNATHFRWHSYEKVATMRHHNDPQESAGLVLCANEWSIQLQQFLFQALEGPCLLKFIMEYPIKMDDLGVPLFSETSI